VGKRGAVLEYPNSREDITAGVQGLDTLVKGCEWTLKTQTPNLTDDEAVVGSFIQVSDVQIRDYEVFFGSLSSEALLDQAVAGTKRDPDLDKHDDAAHPCTNRSSERLRTG
jgi:hypothetical protein